MKEKMTLYQLLYNCVKYNQFEIEQEENLKELLENRENARKEQEKTLYGAILAAKRQMDQEGHSQTETAKKKYYHYLGRFFEGNPICNKEHLTGQDIRDFIMEIMESGEIQTNESYVFFISILLVGLYYMKNHNYIDFNIYDKGIFGFPTSPHTDKNCIENPYTPEEINKINGWIEHNPDDSRGHAVQFFFLGGITPKEIVSLKPDDIPKLCEDRRKIAEQALKLHEDNQEYIFMVEKDGEWKQMSAKGIALKLYYICQETRVQYRPIKHDDSIQTTE